MLTIDQAVELIGDRARILIDVKSPGYEDAIVSAIKRHELGSDCAVSSTYASVLLAVRQGVPSIRRGLSSGHLASGVANPIARKVVTGALRLVMPTAITTAARLIGATDVMVQHRTCTERLVEDAHRLGMRVTCWTVDHERDIERLINLGVDGITSNRPDLVRELVQRRFGSPN